MREACKFNVQIHNGNILMSSVTKDPGVSSNLLFSGSGINFPRPLYTKTSRIRNTGHQYTSWFTPSIPSIVTFIYIIQQVLDYQWCRECFLLGESGFYFLQLAVLWDKKRVSNYYSLDLWSILNIWRRARNSSSGKAEPKRWEFHFLLVNSWSTFKIFFKSILFWF